MLHHNKNPNELPRERRGSKENQGVDPWVTETIIKLITFEMYTPYAREKEVENTAYFKPDCQWETEYRMLEQEILLNIKKVPKLWFLRGLKMLLPHVKAHTPTTDKCNTCSVKVARQRRWTASTQKKGRQQQLEKGPHNKYCITFNLPNTSTL